MGLFDFIIGSKQERKERRAARREFKLEKRAQKFENKADRRDNRTERALGRQRTRRGKVRERQRGRTERVNLRQSGRTSRVTERVAGRTISNLSRDRANEVAYENGMQPTAAGTAMGTLLGVGAAATGIGNAAAKFTAAGGVKGFLGESDGTSFFSDDGMRTNTGSYRPSDGEYYPPPPPPGAPTDWMGIPVIGWLIGAIAAIYFLTQKKGYR